METEDDKKELLYMMVFMIIPAVFLMNMSEFLTSDSGSRILMSGALGLIGGSIGFGVYALTKRLSFVKRIIAVVALLVVLVFTVRYFHNQHEEQLIEDYSVEEDLAVRR